MARCEHYQHKQTRLVAIRYAKQILPGTFENEVSEKANVSAAHVKRSGRR